MHPKHRRRGRSTHAPNRAPTSRAHAPQEHEHSRAFGEDGTAAVWSYGLAMPSRVARPGGFARMAADGPTARCAACRLCAPSAPPHIAHVYCRDCCATACVRPLGLWPWRRPAPPALRVRHQTTGGLMAVDDYVYSSPRVTDSVPRLGRWLGTAVDETYSCTLTHDSVCRDTACETVSHSCTPPASGEPPRAPRCPKRVRDRVRFYILSFTAQQDDVSAVWACPKA